MSSVNKPKIFSEEEKSEHKRVSEGNQESVEKCFKELNSAIRRLKACCLLTSDSSMTCFTLRVLSSKIEASSQGILKRVRSDPEKDLTKEGIEPNPGPPKASKQKSQPKKKVKAANKVATIPVKAKAMNGVAKMFSSGKIPTPAVYSMEVPYLEECLGTVTTAGSAFTNTTYILNPCNTTTFPWLSTIANKFEKYQFHSLFFKFVSSSADAVGSTNTALGTVILNTNYDVLDVEFPTQIAMEDYGGASEDKPSEHQIHKIDCAGKQGGINGQRFNLTSTGESASYPTNSSAHDYDIGRFQIATAGQQAASTLGRLYVCYSLRLIRKKVDNAIPGYSLHVATDVTSTAAAPLTTLLTRTGSTLSFTNTTTTITIATGGRFLFSSLWVSSQTLTAVPTLTASTGATAVNFTVQANAFISVFNGTSNQASCTSMFDLVGPGTVTVGVPTGLTTGGRLDLIVTQVPSDLASRAPRDVLSERISRLESMLKQSYGGDYDSKEDVSEDDCDENSLTDKQLISLDSAKERFKSGQTSVRQKSTLACRPL